MNRTHHDPAAVGAPVGGYTHGCEIAEGRRILFISGQIPETADGSVAADLEGQAHQVWRNIAAVLAAAGMSLDNLVKVTTFLTDRGQVPANRKVRNEVLGDRKVALTVMVATTLEAKWLLEIEAIAMD
ncbi:RidA family protein [Ferrovibrio xuzhouensis]|uniref:RidA family protein n=1 Tax=Ferrovibrio xuzhouensis TaxID=1576914 RepID=A0ABV7VFE2_9PROT